MAKTDTLGDRCKAYEESTRFVLPPRIPKILRLDGRAFHTFLRKAVRPYDIDVMKAMIDGAITVMEDLGGIARFAYIQSDEVTIGINDAIELDTQMYFGGNIQKIVSVCASVMANAFNRHYGHAKTDEKVYETLEYELYGPSYPLASFDARIFTVPDRDLNNVVLWRQQDAARNSVQQYARFYFSHKEVTKKNVSQLQEMMFSKHNFNWNDARPWTKRGVVIGPDRNVIWDIPLFSQDKEFLPKLFWPEKESVEINTVPKDEVCA